MKFSPDGKCLASVGKDQLIRVWALRTEHAKFVDLIKKHTTPDTTTTTSEPIFQHKHGHVSLDYTEKIISRPNLFGNTLAHILPYIHGNIWY